MRQLKTPPSGKYMRLHSQNRRNSCLFFNQVRTEAIMRFTFTTTPPSDRVRSVSYRGRQYSYTPTLLYSYSPRDWSYHRCRYDGKRHHHAGRHAIPERREGGLLVARTRLVRVVGVRYSERWEISRDWLFTNCCKIDFRVWISLDSLMSCSTIQKVWMEGVEEFPRVHFVTCCAGPIPFGWCFQISDTNRLFGVARLKSTLSSGLWIWKHTYTD